MSAPAQTRTRTGSGAKRRPTNAQRQRRKKAFRRRLSLKIDFPIPEVDEREKLWRTLLPREASVADDIDPPVLEDELDFDPRVPLTEGGEYSLDDERKRRPRHRQP